jgi:hypothetical protein
VHGGVHTLRNEAIFGNGFGADFRRLALQTKDGLKMGKSLGNVLEPTVLVSAYGADAVRYFFMKEVVFGQVRSHLAASKVVNSFAVGASRPFRPKVSALTHVTGVVCIGMCRLRCSECRESPMLMHRLKFSCRHLGSQ